MTSTNQERRFTVRRRGVLWTVTDTRTGHTARFLRRHRAETVAAWHESCARLNTRRAAAYGVPDDLYLPATPTRKDTHR